MDGNTRAELGSTIWGLLIAGVIVGVFVLMSQCTPVKSDHRYDTKPLSNPDLKREPGNTWR